MDEKDKAKALVLKEVEELEDFLESALPNADKKHKDEILDICVLLRHRVETYINEYGVNECFNA